MATSPQDLVEDVLREAQALLGDDPEADAGAERPPTEPDAAEPVDVQGLVDRVDSLLGDLGHLVEDVETAERDGVAPGLDLTVVLPRQAPDPKDVVPDHGPAGPQVDLFAAPEPAPEPTSTAPASPVVLETADSSSTTEPESATTETAGSATSILDDLSAALADEFDEPALAATESPDASIEPESVAPSVESTSPEAAAAEAALFAAMTEEFGAEPTELPPVEDEGDPFESSSTPAPEPSDAARRLEALLAKRLAEEYDLVEQAASTTPTVLESEADATELAQSDIDAVARAEMEALEALGSDLDTESTPAREAETSGESITEIDAVSSGATVPDVPASAVPEVVESTAFTETTVVDAQDAPDERETPDEPAAESGDGEASVERGPADDEAERPAPRRVGPSVLVRIGAAPFRYLPRALHRHATPVALSLLAWVPLAWGYALLAPSPVPPRLDVLRTGFDRHPASESSEVSHAAVVDPHADASSTVETTGHEPASGESHDAGHH